jgi:uncharacterized protein (TIGR02687 family)
MSNKITTALNVHFKNHRLVFWYDDDGKMKDIYDSYEVPDNGLKLDIDQNEFKLRHTLLKEYPDKKALLYSDKAKPKDKDNWLLDLQLANFLFASNQAALVQQELELTDSFLPLIQEHSDYFANRKERLQPLKAIIQPTEETQESLKLSMIAVLCGHTRGERERRKNFSEIILNVLLNNFLASEPSIWQEIEKHKLDGFFYELAERDYDFKAENPNLDALLSYLLNMMLNFQLGKEHSPRARSIYTMLDNWRKHQDYSFRVQKLINLYEKQLNIPYELSKVESLEELSRVDLYKEADRGIFARLLEGLLEDKLESSSALKIIEARRETYWYKSGSSDQLVYHYRTLYYYLMFRERLAVFRPDFRTVEEGWQAYIEDYAEIDGDYRRFLHAIQESDSSSTFSALLDKLEKDYTEAYLQPLADSWQAAIDIDPSLEGIKHLRMGSFFKRFLGPYLRNDRSVFVLISDGLRYEIGAELAGMLRQKTRFQVEMTTLQAPSPSYTQLGMASLLPHRELTIAGDGNIVLADGQSTVGLENRQKVVQTWLNARYPGKKVRAMQADRFVDMPRSEQSDFIRGIDLVFLYSAGVDSVGDDAKTELRLPKAAADELRKLDTLCGYIGKNLSRTHIIVTADHGFLFRYREVPDTERTKLEQDPAEVRRDHRFLFSPNPKPHPATDILEFEQTDWSAPFQVQFARGVDRFRRPGGGTRYVHGGRMLQELCVPLLTIRKTRTDDVSPVEIAVVDRQSRITSGQVTINFLQDNPVEAKRPAREVEAVFEGTDGTDISNKLRLIFDSTDPVDQNRARKVQFIFTREAEKYNGKMIYLKLYDLRSSGLRSFYKEYTYRFQKMLRTDVDF